MTGKATKIICDDCKAAIYIDAVGMKHWLPKLKRYGWVRYAPKLIVCKQCRAEREAVQLRLVDMPGGLVDPCEIVRDIRREAQTDVGAPAWA